MDFFIFKKIHVTYVCQILRVISLVVSLFSLPLSRSDI